MSGSILWRPQQHSIRFFMAARLAFFLQATPARALGPAPPANTYRSAPGSALGSLMAGGGIQLGFQVPQVFIASRKRKAVYEPIRVRILSPGHKAPAASRDNQHFFFASEYAVFTIRFHFFFSLSR